MLLTLNKAFFNKRVTCKLSGINERQFDYFIKYVGLIEDKPRYNLNDILYIAYCNSLRDIGLSWQEIHKIVCKPVVNDRIIKDLNFINYDVISSVISNDEEIVNSTISKNDLFTQKVKKDCNEGRFVVFMDKDQEIEKISKRCIMLSFPNKKVAYIVLIFMLIDDIIKKSKELDLKVDVEQIFKSA